MGYTTVNISRFVPSSKILRTAGTWTAGLNANVVSEARGAADAAFTLLVPLELEAGDTYHEGARVKSVELFYKVSTAACDDFATVELERVTLPANGSAPGGAALACVIDAAHDTAAKRKAQGEHTMLVTPGADLWLEDDYGYWLACVVDAAAGSVFTLYGARIQYELRL